MASDNDSLFKQIEKTNDSKELISLYNQLGNNLRYAYPDSALLFYRNSLKLAEASNNKALYADALSSISSVYAIKNMYDSAHFYGHKSLVLQIKIENRDGEAKTRNSMGLIELTLENYGEAQKQLKKTIEIGVELQDSFLLSKGYNNLGLLYKRKHDYDSALYFYLESLKVKELIGEYDGMGATANNIALIYNSLKEYDLAIKYIKQALKIRQHTGNEYGEAMVLNNFGMINESRGDFEEALKKYKTSLEIMQKLNKPGKISILYNNIGSVYIKLKDYKNAHLFLQNALQINKEIGNIRGQINSILTLAKFFEELKIYQNAISNYRQAYVLLHQIEDVELVSQVYEGLYTCFERNMQFDSALIYYREFTLLNDSIYNTYSRRNIEKLEIEYQSLKKEKENQDLYRQNQLKEEKITRFFWVGIFLAILIGVLIISGFFLITGKQKLQKTFKLVLQQRNSIQQQSVELKKAYSKLEQFSKFKEELTGMIVHDLKNPLNIILNVTGMRDYPNRDKVIHNAGKQMMNLIMNILDVYKYECSQFVLDKSRVFINKIIFDITRELEFVLLEKGNSLITEFEYDYQVSIDLLAFERILINLLSNAIKFSPTGGKIVLRTETINPKKFRIHVIDSGDGIPEGAMDKIFEKFEQHESRSLGFSASTGIGLTYCKMAVEAHDGVIGVFNSESGGADFYIELEYFAVNLANQNRVVRDEIPKEISQESRSVLYPYVMALVDKDVFEVSEIKNILKLVRKEIPEVARFCQQVEHSVVSCNQQAYDELLDLVINT